MSGSFDEELHALGTVRAAAKKKPRKKPKPRKKRAKPVKFTRGDPGGGVSGRQL